ncbi:TPA: toxin-antitoxin system HicB family antitoxin [Campylobacter jejuni]|uniref:toxin-antitoxin system HicB family antitoxin n=1 Tax=Campylobacter coli TaxID=195 RepID=UPI0024DE7048|nr:toxin-antitoxin system HicB family antitoxin [Campylobacter coli]MDK2054211.1 toxin-antitoxin system HicB family antitoxin [Campylobacter coli]MDK2077426.1 toxin-antitoxin system HicB family antitoxin [Campylobacter coli]
MLSQIQNNTSIQVASFYEVTKNSITKHFLRNADELIENIHYFYDYEQTKGGRQRVIKWTLEGVYKLFDKIKKLKERSKMAEEKESKGSYNLQIKIPNELKDKLEKKAEKAGVSLNQYIMYLFIDDIKNERI